MRIILLHVPPWKIPGDSPAGVSSIKQENSGGNNPLIPVFEPFIEDDFAIMPYGLFSLAAQALRAGHDVSLYNIALFPWYEIEELIREIDAGLFGLSSFTANRRGMAAVARLIKELHPRAHVTAGGAFVSPLPAETLAHYEFIDTVVMGEGEETFMELVSRLEKAEPVVGIPGTAWRNGARIEIGPARPRIQDLDSLASPLDYFSTQIILSSRGCPGSCTFCASPATWGKKLTFHSDRYVLDMLETAVTRHGRRFLLIKDDTFTANKKRALSICRGIQKRNLNFLWSCDTRVDCLDEELLFAMRSAGCCRLSLGVESGSPEVLGNIKKRVSPEQVLKATRMAKKFGFQVRYYMMVGNRGETLASFRKSIDLIEQGLPNQYVFALLNLNPGTEDSALLYKKGIMCADDFFNSDFAALLFCDAESLDARRSMIEWLYGHQGLQNYWDYSTEEYRHILKTLPNLGAANIDLAGALCREGREDEAEFYLERALELGYPEGFIYNYRACIAAERKEFRVMIENLEKGRACYPHHIIMKNLQLARNWLNQGGPDCGLPLNLEARHDFEVNLKKEQPLLPGPIFS
ncbi:MAG: radical SAM protein [bacterium]|nr:radical SAM protein [bacterium]